MAKPRLAERASRLLVALVRQIPDTNWYSLTADPELLAVSYSADKIEWGLLLDILEEGGFLERNGRNLKVTPRGFLKVEDELSVPNKTTSQCFVAMSFDNSMNEVYTNGFSVGIGAAGYRPLRIDQKEHINGISDEILSEIRRSRFVVADYTLANNGVYFEAGFAIGLDIPVIPTCRSNFASQLHFDIRHINTLMWERSEDLKASLERRIAAVIGRGPI